MEKIELPPGFDLPAAWRALAAGQEEDRRSFMVRLSASPAALSLLRSRFGELTPQPEGWTEITLPFASYESARSYLLGLGAAVEVLEPEPLRQGMCDFARQILTRYTGRSEVG